MAYQTPIDIANVGLQHCGQFKISAFSDDSREAKEVNTCYDNIRLSELMDHDWIFAIRRARVRAVTFSTQIWTPPAFNLATTYATGQVVMFAGGTYANAANYAWVSTLPGNVGNSPDISTQWSHYFGNTKIDIFDPGANYAAGEVVIQPAAWASGVTYNAGDIVVGPDLLMYVSLLGTNIGHTPATSPTQWIAWVAPSLGGPPNAITNLAGITFNVATAPGIYFSIRENNGPTQFNSGNPGVPTVPLPSNNLPYWVSTGGTLQQFTPLFPIGCGPANDPTTANLYPLPATFMREAINFDKEQGRPYLGALYGKLPRDFTFFDQYFTSGSAGPWDINFVADIADVTLMKTSFCDVVAARIGLKIDVALTGGKNRETILTDYNRTFSRALQVDMIQQGTPVEELEELVRVRF